ncbi:MAG: response regulator transcription factor [Acidobacteriota bacterium]
MNLTTQTVFACESQPIVLEGLETVLARSNEFSYAGSATSLTEALSAVRELRPDIMMVDHSAGLKMVFQFISDVKNTWSRCQPVLWVGDLAEIDCFRALQIGARGVLKKSLPVDAVLDCLRTVAAGNIWIEGSVEQAQHGFERRSSPRLTPREREIVQQICAGLKNKEIAGTLSITAGTVKVHLMHIFEKTGVKDRFELAIHGRKLLGLEHSESVHRLEAAS